MSEKITARSYRDLVVWQKGIALVKEIYRLSSKFPAEEKFGLVSQMRRAAVSVPSNIAEGQARNTTSQFIHLFPLPKDRLRNWTLNLSSQSNWIFARHRTRRTLSV